jgi:histidinol-phosphate aminotransferase
MVSESKSPYLRAVLESIPAYKPGRKVVGPDGRSIKLSSNESPYGPLPSVREAITEASADLNRYPDPGATELVARLAAHLGVPEEHVALGAGSVGLLQQLLEAVGEPGAEVVYAWRSFEAYPLLAELAGVTSVRVPLKDETHDLDALLAAITENTRMVLVCNPNNPSGTYVDAAALNAFMDKVPAHFVVVLDEAYVEYVTAADFPDALELIERYPNLIVLRTFSKIYGLAGLRIGYGIARPQLTDLLNWVREPFNTSRVGQKAAVTALDDEAYRDECHRKNKAGKEQYYAAFEKLGLDYYPTEANFVMVDVGRPADEVFQPLLRQGLIVRAGEALGFPTKLRITIGTEEQNEKIIRALTNIVKRVPS